MIEIFGATDTSESRAAEKVRNALSEILPPEADCNDDVRIIVSAKAYGERRQDIDLVVMGKLQRPLRIPSGDVVQKDARLFSFFLTVEVKDHPPTELYFEGPKVFVRYRERRADASEQAEEQKYSAMGYIEKSGLSAPRIASILLLNNVPTEMLPQGRHNILGGDFTAQRLLEVIYLAYESRLGPDRVLIQAFSQRDAKQYLDVARLFTLTLTPTKLDRKKIELVTRRAFDQKYAQLLGQQMLIYTGPGGTGKTANLLQLAHFVYRELGKRVLILTYNLALVADIKRLLALMEMRDDIATAQVAISSVHSFMYQLLCNVKLFRRGADDFFDRYTELKAELLEVLDALDTSDVEPWDFVFVDEAQDWPDDERRIMFKLYGAQNMVVADGQTQLVRTHRHCDWTSGETTKNQKIPLRKALRLKHDMCIFVSRFLDSLGLAEWQMTPNVSAYGGRVILVIGSLMEERAIIDDVINDAIGDGNAPVDLLFCVPPSLVGRERPSVLAKHLKGCGYKVWDGVDQVERHSYPTDIDELRVVQYDSCRGLEGWAVVNFAIDQLYDYKKATYVAADGEKDLFLSDREAAERFARRWVAIPMTRAIDTLVINVQDPTHWILEPLLSAVGDNENVKVIRLGL